MDIRPEDKMSNEIVTETAGVVQHTEVKWNDEAQVPGSKLTYGELRQAGVPEGILNKISAIVQHVTPRRVGLVEANGDWYVYRSLSRQEFKMLMREAAERISKKAEAAAKAGKELNPALLNAESQNWLEERVASLGSVMPHIDQSTMNDGEAGVPKLLHDAILSRSNFEQTSAPITL